MKKITIVPMIAALTLGLAACGKPTETTNVTTTETNTIVDDADANLTATDGVTTDNSADLDNVTDGNVAGNAL